MAKVNQAGNQPTKLEVEDLNLTDQERIVLDIVYKHSADISGSESSFYNDQTNGQSYLYLDNLMGYGPMKFPMNKLQMELWLKVLNGEKHNVFHPTEEDMNGATSEDLASVDDVRKVVFKKVFDGGNFYRVRVLPYGSQKKPGMWTVKIYTRRRNSPCLSFFVDKDGEEMQALRKARHII